MKKTLVSLMLALLIIMSTTTAIFAVDDVGLSIGKGQRIVTPCRVDDTGL